MGHSAKLSFIFFTILFVHQTTWGQESDGAIATQRAQTKRDAAQVEEPAVAKADTVKAKAKARKKAAKAKASSTTSGSSGVSGVPSEESGVDPCTINKNLPECHNSSMNTGG